MTGAGMLTSGNKSGSVSTGSLHSASGDRHTKPHCGGSASLAGAGGGGAGVDARVIASPTACKRNNADWLYSS